MSGQQTAKSDKWQIARAAAWELVASLPGGSKAALITFTDKTQTRATLSADFGPIQDWLNSEAARHPESLKGQTALYGAILAAVKALQPTEPGDAIYVITDAGENASRTRASEVEKALGTSHIRLFAFVLSNGVFILPVEQEGLARLSDMSRNSGGFMTGLDAKNVFQYESPRSWRYIYDDQAKSQIRFSAQKFSLQIASFYTLTFQIPENPTKPQRWELEVVDAGGHKRKDVTLAYPRELFPRVMESAPR